MTDSLLAPLLICAVFFFFFAFFAGSEVAFFSIVSRKVRLFLGEGKKGAASLDALKQDPDRFLLTILIGNNLSNAAAVCIGTVIVLQFFGTTDLLTVVTVAIFLITVVMLVVGEIIPKIYANQHAEKIALAVSPPIQVLSFIFSPVIWVLGHFSHLISGDKPLTTSMVTQEDIREWIHVGAEEGTIEEEEQQMLYSVLEFGDIPVRKVMTRRQDVAMLEDTATSQQALEIFQETRFSRLPIYHDTMDTVVGILNIKDLFTPDLINDHHVSIAPLASEPYFIPDSKKIDDLLREMQKKKTHMAIVLDEYGTFEGVITVEDILEELVGDILDEYDTDETEIIRISDTRFSIDASCSMEDINEELGLFLPVSEEYETIAGFVMTCLGHIPCIGEKLTVEEFGDSITVTHMEANRITRVRLELNPREEAVQ
jgi:CBS domain containing-hemolysin-like protein